jgi:glycine cleavage system aminomethyltransferase T
LVALRLAGEETLQLLQLEAGVPLPHLDFAPAREPFARTPLPAALGAYELEDRNESEGGLVLAGLELESDRPVAFAPVFAGHAAAGRTLRSLYSPAFRGAIALAELAPKYAATGTGVSVRHVDSGGARDIAARVVALPFL